MLHFEFLKSTFHSYKAGHLLFSKVTCMYFHTLEWDLIQTQIHDLTELFRHFDQIIWKGKDRIVYNFVILQILCYNDDDTDSVSAL